MPRKPSIVLLAHCQTILIHSFLGCRKTTPLILTYAVPSARFSISLFYVSRAYCLFHIVSGSFSFSISLTLTFSLSYLFLHFFLTWSLFLFISFFRNQVFFFCRRYPFFQPPVIQAFFHFVFHRLLSIG